jgi:hypothetical protein
LTVKVERIDGGKAPMHRRDVVRRRGDFSGAKLTFQNIERQAHALRACAG